MSNRVSDVQQRLSSGTTARGFEPVRLQLDAYLLDDAAYSAQLAVFWRDELVVDLVGGADLEADSVTGVFSVSKGVAGIVIAMLVQQGALELDAPVAAYWPEFEAHGKASITVRQLLSHQAGVVGVHPSFERSEVLHSGLAAARLASTSPQWRPGSGFGYHGLTMGIFMEELVRRVTNQSLQAFYETEIRKPRNIDFYLGFPASEERRFRELLPMRPTATQQAAMDHGPSSNDSISSLAFNSLHRSDLPLDSKLSPNLREVRAAGPSALGGIGSARGLASVYGAATGNVGGPRLLDEATIAAFSQQQSWGHDRILNVDMCFGVVFMKPQPRMDFGSYLAFGHDGAGGAIGFADPLYGTAFGYIPMPMQYPGGADPKAVRLAQIVRSCVQLLA
jgi:CubicO group peptidase (beta-lactamase class C family)